MARSLGEILKEMGLIDESIRFNYDIKEEG